MKKLLRGTLTAAWVALSSLGVQAAEVGSVAPEFSGHSQLGPVELTELRGKNVVLAFYFADFTPV